MDKRFQITVVVQCSSLAEATSVMHERLADTEDHGFEYRLMDHDVFEIREWPSDRKLVQ